MTLPDSHSSVVLRALKGHSAIHGVPKWLTPWMSGKSHRARYTSCARIQTLWYPWSRNQLGIGWSVLAEADDVSDQDRSCFLAPEPPDNARGWRKLPQALACGPVPTILLPCRTMTACSDRQNVLGVSHTEPRRLRSDKGITTTGHSTRDCFGSGREPKPPVERIDWQLTAPTSPHSFSPDQQSPHQTPPRWTTHCIWLPTMHRSSMVLRITHAPCQSMLCLTTQPSSSTQSSPRMEYSSSFAPFSIRQLLPMKTGFPIWALGSILTFSPIHTPSLVFGIGSSMPTLPSRASLCACLILLEAAHVSPIARCQAAMERGPSVQ